MATQELESQAEKPDIDQLMLDDINLRAELMIMDAFQSTDEDKLFFQSTTYAGIEVERVRVQPDPLFKREPRDVIDLVADIRELVLIEPTEVVRLFLGNELPTFLIEVRKKGSEPDLVRLDREEDTWKLSRADRDDPWGETTDADLRTLAVVIREYLDHGVPIEQFPLKATIPIVGEDLDDEAAA